MQRPCSYSIVQARRRLVGICCKRPTLSHRTGHRAPRRPSRAASKPISMSPIRPTRRRDLREDLTRAGSGHHAHAPVAVAVPGCLVAAFIIRGAVGRAIAGASLEEVTRARSEARAGREATKLGPGSYAAGIRRQIARGAEAVDRGRDTGSGPVAV